MKCVNNYYILVGISAKIRSYPKNVKIILMFRNTLSSMIKDYIIKSDIQ